METNYKYVSQLTKQQTNEHIQEIERVTNRKILEAETAEDKKAYLYKTISTLTETKDAILWKNRDLVKDLEEEYGQMELCEKDEEERMFQEQQQVRKQGLELPKILLPKYLYYEEYKPT
ncbi:34312_t:CDS:2, partial [Racocetra persica]